MSDPAQAYFEMLREAGLDFLPRVETTKQHVEDARTMREESTSPERDGSRVSSSRTRASAPARPRPSEAAATALAETAAEIAACTGCRLCETRTRTVPGEGNPNADLVFVGEGPGADEDASGRPFVGRAGKLLTKMIGAMGLSREDVFIANIVKCRPPGNRDPQADEVAACRPYLQRQLASIAPRVIVTLGKPAALTLLGLPPSTPISRIRGRFHELDGIPLMPTYHPAYLLRSPSQKRPVWEDLRKVMELLGLPLQRPEDGGR